MQCPKCGSNTFVIRTVDKIAFTFRRRECKNRRCRHRFNTKEMLSDDWNYKAIVDDIWEILRSVKLGRKYN